MINKMKRFIPHKAFSERFRLLIWSEHNFLSKPVWSARGLLCHRQYKKLDCTEPFLTDLVCTKPLVIKLYTTCLG